jgi:hypothetical protein
MSTQPMTCTACEREIPRGDQYVAVTRQTERVGRLGAVKVQDAELIAAYHPGCVPAKGRA